MRSRPDLVCRLTFLDPVSICTKSGGIMDWICLTPLLFVLYFGIHQNSPRWLFSNRYVGFCASMMFVSTLSIGKLQTSESCYYNGSSGKNCIFPIRLHVVSSGRKISFGQKISAAPRLSFLRVRYKGARVFLSNTVDRFFNHRKIYYSN